MKNPTCCLILILLAIALVAYFKAPKSSQNPRVDHQVLHELLLGKALKTALSDSLIRHYVKRDSAQYETIKQLHYENSRLQQLEKGPVPPVYLAAPADSILREFLRRTS